MAPKNRAHTECRTVGSGRQLQQTVTGSPGSATVQQVVTDSQGYSAAGGDKFTSATVQQVVTNSPCSATVQQVVTDSPGSATGNRW